MGVVLDPLWIDIGLIPTLMVPSHRVAPIVSWARMYVASALGRGGRAVDDRERSRQPDHWRNAGAVASRWRQGKGPALARKWLLVRDAAAEDRRIVVAVRTKLADEMNRTSLGGNDLTNSGTSCLYTRTPKAYCMNVNFAPDCGAGGASSSSG